MTQPQLLFYEPYFKMPIYWRYESGSLPQAVESYLSLCSKGTDEPTAEEIVLIKTYLDYYINAPCWDHDKNFRRELRKLRSEIKEIKDCREISAWVSDCQSIGLSPL